MRHFLKFKATELGVPEKSFERTAVDCLLEYGWPGNVRELENAVERALALSQGLTLTIDDLPPHLTVGHELAPIPATASNGSGRTSSLSAAVEQLEHALIVDALTQADHNQTRAAELLGTTRRILKYKMDKLGIVGQDSSEIT
jgi:DNA-binding NtrC family response regulator